MQLGPIIISIYRAGCPIGFLHFPSVTGCYKVVIEALNWTQSQARCPQLDPRAHLAVITSKQQNDDIVNYTMSLG